MEPGTADLGTLVLTVLREQGVAVLLIVWLLWFVTSRVWVTIAQEIVPAWLRRLDAAATTNTLLVQTVVRIEQSFDRFVEALERIAGTSDT